MKLINADDFENKILHSVSWWDNKDEDVVYNVLNQQPTVEERQVAHWIEHIGYSKCSKCGNCSTYESNYCPNCGAKMEE